MGSRNDTLAPMKWPLQTKPPAPQLFSPWPLQKAAATHHNMRCKLSVKLYNTIEEDGLLAFETTKLTFPLAPHPCMLTVRAETRYLPVKKPQQLYGFLPSSSDSVTFCKSG